MTTITTSKGSELTPDQIASMSDVIAEYMYPKKGNSYNVAKGVFLGSNHIDFLNWNKLHEVWEKVREDKNIINSEMEGEIYFSFMSGNKPQTFEALFNAIQFINQLKQKNVRFKI